MTEEVEVETRQIYLIPTEGPDGMQNTEASLRIAVTSNARILLTFY